jgi:cyclopropane fatty-acyl-phospholipid synthase-like methyltransferase
MPSGYSVLAGVYDRWQNLYGQDFSTIIFPRVLETIRIHQIPTGDAIDLACGTGSLAMMLARRGWRVQGIDASEGMLKEGKRKLRGMRLPVTLSCQRMEKFRVRAPVELALSMFDAVNHLMTERALASCFRSTAAALVRGGYFVFDVNTLHCYETVWRQTESFEGDNFTLILQNAFDGDRDVASSAVTLFQRRGRRYEKSGEIVHERYYPADIIRSNLEQSGFRVLDCEDFNFTHNPLVGDIKTWWVAQKK